MVARDLPGGKRSLVMNMMAQHITFNKAIKPIVQGNSIPLNLL